MYRRVRLRHLIIWLAVVSGCASIDPFTDSSAPTSTPTQAVANHFNAADVSFVRAMIAHERFGLALSERVPDAGSDVTTIAGHLVDEAGGRIAMMSEWLNEWNQVDSTNSVAVATSSTGLDDLVALSGPGFEALWVELMIEHHTRGIGLAEVVQRDGLSRDVNKFVSGILLDLRFEVGRLEAVGEG